MIIGKDLLRLYYWGYSRTGGGPSNLPEIESGEYGYNLEPGQQVFAIRYYGTNMELYFNADILEISDEGIKIKENLLKGEEVFCPWVKEFPSLYDRKIMCQLYIEPCEELYEKNKLKDVLAGNIDNETYKNNKIDTDRGCGIWYLHGGWRGTSKYEGNLKNFVKLGQMEMEV